VIIKYFFKELFIMTKITQEKFLEMLKGDKDMVKRLAAYLGGTKDEQEIIKKTNEFAKKEGYELEAKQSLDVEDLANVSGGGLIGSIAKRVSNLILGIAGPMPEQKSATKNILGDNGNKDAKNVLGDNDNKDAKNILS
jgi:hypothetical protein